MLDKELVQHVAHLSKLEFDEADLEKFTLQLDEIIQMENELTAVDTTNVRPTTHIARQESTFRADEPQKGPSRTELLSNVPEQADGFIKVPSILTTEED
ncbi:Asp-tRNA(Asn)/Glu-tRNA(Gln) amidotransferase subunit GatC [Bombilactobacillus thymidiniphilus]|uniref:Aspartyl/glutamyl-tRNA(Asn/Gln) amidotransferase subunit C n=1 Tax=Bombilactobacillus thymidiniphilus TaxID=2923363 RepID=A0ABY4PCB6_9LACO|nr:Asp-tRNA(Asn)/Glu-tRNA(Gln) amidotransferase subunit GatC [Bombilactobacillus thymidiniphilus]UQS83235.1 Asp-tRNA(Asn)/Glu-tRNA(Gln) amidotransferase subunit GatC [Bombilactobacillus thymidiniphilus]